LIFVVDTLKNVRKIAALQELIFWTIKNYFFKFFGVLIIIIIIIIIMLLLASLVALPTSDS
jgi:hypothetical protein